MANYNRTIISSVWTSLDFRKMTDKEKVLYFWLHTGEITSDSSAFPCLIDDCAHYCGMKRKDVESILKKFQELGLVFYDYEEENVVVLDYFDHHPPVGGIKYEMFAKDLAKITSDKVIDVLIENSKNYKISIAFFAALQDLRPEIKAEDFQIKNSSDKTVEEIREVANIGRKNAAAKRKEMAAAYKEKVEADVISEQTTDKVDSSQANTDEDLPF